MRGQYANHKQLAHMKNSCLHRKKRYVDRDLMLYQQRCDKHSIFVMQGQRTNHKHLAHMKNYTLGIKSLTLDDTYFDFMAVSALAHCQMARQNAILLTKSAKL